MTLLRSHLDLYCGAAPDALVFSLESGLPIRRISFNKLTGWKKATAQLGIPELHFHDLRHTGNMLAAGSKVATNDLMARMGHDSMEAALIYQHARREADQSIVAHLDKQLEGLDAKKIKKAGKKAAKAAKSMRESAGRQALTAGEQKPASGKPVDHGMEDGHGAGTVPVS